MSAPPINEDNPPDGRAGNWRQSIAQSFRSEEVRSIAKELASLEPGLSSASKMPLAMKFEEFIFKSATDFDDYRKKIQKRIKKLKKTYSEQQSIAGGVGGGKGVVENADLMREKVLLLQSELRDEFGARLLYIAKNADEAVRLIRENQDDHKADVLLSHIENAKQWAVDLGLELPAGTGSFVKDEKRDMESMNKLKKYLETRVDHIRSHIIKYTDPVLFLEEKIVEIDDTMLKDKVTEVFRKALKADPDGGEFSVEKMKQLMELINAPVPIPRRNQEGDSLQAAVARIEKVRVASQALYTYVGLPLAGKTSFRGTMEKCVSVVSDCLNELEGDYNNLVKEVDGVDADGKRIILLEDAWNNPMQFAESENEETPAIEETISEEPDTKRQKTDSATNGKAPMVIRSRFLLTSGRKTFSTLLPELKKKRAKLVRNRSATFVKLEFGDAFEMTIYFEPLLVTIRAKDHSQDEAFSTGGLCWPSLYQGLGPSGKDSRDVKENNLSVLGVMGSYESLGPIIAKKLEYASAQASYVLRRCFAETAVGKSALAKSEYEKEMLEAGAFIRFLRIARATYNPDWVDVDP
ncbi:hypothetical protein ACHAW5_000295 [Stephanodiscus triporus]|uniref:Mediator complex subunit 15 KIX domain-containing protein n=1 Tax=Stephanodiscus triporus TaxID=2934178 RepID=A0ABD3ML51_9STRA